MKTSTHYHVEPQHRFIQILRTLSIGLMFIAIAPLTFAAEGITTAAGPEGPAQTAYSPANGKPGPVIIVISGLTGPTSYRPYSMKLTELGYYTVLVNGKDILNPEHSGAGNLKQAINRAQHSPNAIPGKVAVIGFSLGGGGALLNAANLTDNVSMVVAYYPFTRTWADKINVLADHFQVPILVLAGGLDRHKNCCVVETAQAMEIAAKARKLPFELVVYPNANHGFNLETGATGEPMGAYRADDSSNA